MSKTVTGTDVHDGKYQSKKKVAALRKGMSAREHVVVIGNLGFCFPRLKKR